MTELAASAAHASCPPLRGPGNLVTEGPGWVGAARLQPPAPPSQTSGPGSVSFDDSAWQPLTLPHDYLAWLAPNNTSPVPHQAEHGYVPFADSWYRKRFSVPAGTGLVRLVFDGGHTAGLNEVRSGVEGAFYLDFFSLRHRRVALCLGVFKRRPRGTA